MLTKKIVSIALFLIASPLLAQTDDQDIGLLRRDYQFSLGLGVATDGESEHKTAAITRNDGEVHGAKGDLGWGDAYVVNLELKRMPMNSWGHSVGLLYTGNRALDAGILTMDNNHKVFIPSGLSAADYTLYSNLIFRWEVFYMSAGLNFSKKIWNAGDSNLRIVHNKGGIAGQLGLGWKLTRDLAIEYHFFVSSFDAEFASRDAAEQERYRLGSSEMYSSVFALKYDFN